MLASVNATLSNSPPHLSAHSNPMPLASLMAPSHPLRSQMISAICIDSLSYSEDRICAWGGGEIVRGGTLVLSLFFLLSFPSFLSLLPLRSDYPGCARGLLKQ